MLKIVAIAAGLLVVLLVAFVAWRWTSVARGARERDQILVARIDPIGLVETVRRAVDGKEADFHVYRYRMAAGHPESKDGWLLGLAGPMNPDTEPYTQMPGAFSRAGDIYGKVKPTELVDWYLWMLRRKGIIK